MIFLRKNQRGFTLIEMLAALAITGLIGTGITVSIFQVLDINDCISHRMVAITQVENAGYWITRDAEMAQSIVTEGAALTLAWVGWEYQSPDGNTCIDTHEVCYTHADSELWRDQTITTDKYDSDGSFLETTESHNSMLVAEHITAITPELDGKKLTVPITASVEELEEERTYEITPRPN